MPYAWASQVVSWQFYRVFGAFIGKSTTLLDIYNGRKVEKLAMYTLLIVLHVIFCVFLILVILLQTGKGAGIGAAFGGGSQTVFGPRGAGSFIGKLTGIVAALFMLTSLILAYLSSSGSTGVADKVNALNADAKGRPEQVQVGKSELEPEAVPDGKSAAAVSGDASVEVPVKADAGPKPVAPQAKDDLKPAVEEPAEKPRSALPQGLDEKPKAAPKGLTNRPKAAPKGLGNKPKAAPKGLGNKPKAVPEGLDEKPKAAPEGSDEKPKAAPEGSDEKPKATPEGPDNKPKSLDDTPKAPPMEKEQ